MNSFQDAFLDAVNNIFSTTTDFLPNLLAGTIIFVLGIFIANWIKKIIVKSAHKINLNKIFKSENFDKFLEQAEFQGTIENILGNIVKWLLILIFTVTAANVLGLSAISTVLNNILGYIPNIFSAILIFIIGIIIAGIVEKFVKGAVNQFDRRTGRLVSKVSSYILVVFSAMAALSELGIAKEFLNILFIGFISSISLGLGLAIGLGSKDLVSEGLNNWYKKVKKDLEDKK